MNASEPLVSVVIPTHNRASLLQRAVDSVLSQSYGNLELIVVDDASSDDTPSVVASHDDDRVRYLSHAECRGGSAARNTGIRAGRGEFVGFLDDDDAWLSGKLARQVQAVGEADLTPAPVVYTGLAYLDAAGQHIRTVRPQKQGQILPDLLYGNYVGSASAVLAPRDAVVECGGFDERLQSCQDWDLWIRLAMQCRYVAIPEPLVEHYVHGERIDTNLAAQVQGRLRLLDKLNPHLENVSWWQRRRILSNHYLLIAGHYAAHRRPADAFTWIKRSCMQHPLNVHAWLLLFKVVMNQ